MAHLALLKQRCKRLVKAAAAGFKTIEAEVEAVAKKLAEPHGWLKVLVGEAKILPGVHIIWLQIHGAFPVVDGLRSLPLGLAGVRHGIKGLRVIRLYLKGLIETVSGMFPFTALTLQQANLQKDMDGSGIQFESLKEMLGGLVQITGEPGLLTGLKVS